MKKMMVRFQQALQSVKNEHGAAAIEYGLLAGLISVVIIVAVTNVGTTLTNVFEYISTQLASVNTGT